MRSRTITGVAHAISAELQLTIEVPTRNPLSAVYLSLITMILLDLQKSMRDKWFINNFAGIYC